MEQRVFLCWNALTRDREQKRSKAAKRVEGEIAKERRPLPAYSSVVVPTAEVGAEGVSEEGDTEEKRAAAVGEPDVQLLHHSGNGGGAVDQR